MDDMYYKNYCLICFGPHMDLNKLIISIAEPTPVMRITGDSLLMATFTSSIDLNIIEELLVDAKYSFTLFEMNKSKSRAHSEEVEIQRRMFDDFFYKDSKLDGEKEVSKAFSGQVGTDYVNFIDVVIDPSELYLSDLLRLLENSIRDENFEESARLRDEIKEVDEEFYIKNVKGNIDLK